MAQTDNARLKQLERWVSAYRTTHPEADSWAKGFGAISHDIETQARLFDMAENLSTSGVRGDGVPVFDLLRSLDIVTNAAMWIVVHETYARSVYLDGRELVAEDFKPRPEGHTGGALNMTPAYAGYMAANALTGKTRSWIMGQGHTVAAIDTVNLLLDNMLPAHAERYSISDEGLTRYVRDFYSYRLTSNGKQDSPLGSHVNPNTAGGMVEGGYLGFTELQYVHMPLPGESLVVFLSDGAFEEQRGSDWTPRWWRAEDTGAVLPIMISNGRRIDQRTTMSQQGGSDWFVDHLDLNNFDPFVFDGADPAAFVWAIMHMENRLAAAGEAVRSGVDAYPVRLPYGIAVSKKGEGFFGAGTNLAHALPLLGNPHLDPVSAHNFNESARRLRVPKQDLISASKKFQNHGVSSRPRERDHSLSRRDVSLDVAPEPLSRPVPADRRDIASWTRTSPMFAVDAMFIATVQANPHLRPRVGNPDEMRSNRLLKTLDALKFRVSAPEEGVPEDILGSVITALNEEAVASAALANKAGINLIHTYEAFGTKMQGVIRQELIWANHCKELGRPVKWLSLPLILTSHTWENGKNEVSHQDPAMAESMLGEPSDVSRVLFPPDYTTASVMMSCVYQTRGQVWTAVVSKNEAAPDLFTLDEAQTLLRDGAARLDWAGHAPDGQRVVITAVGSYQLEEAVKASNRLRERGIPHTLVYMLEPGRFRTPRSDGEAAHAAEGRLVQDLYPGSVEARVFVTHTRPEPLLGALQPLHTGHRKTKGLGYIGKGGTLTAPGMLFVNRSTWAHIVETVANVLETPREDILSVDELAAIDFKRSPEGVLI